MSTIRCSRCNLENESDRQWCDNCGARLPSSDESSEKDARFELPEGEKERLEADEKADSGTLRKWVDDLPELVDTNELKEAEENEDESLPSWLSALQGQADELARDENGGPLDWLAEIEPDQTGKEAKPTTDSLAQKAPAWVSELMPEETWPESEDDSTLAKSLEEIAEAEAEELPSKPMLPTTKPLVFSRELKGVPDKLAGSELPEWLEESDDQQAAEVEREMPDAEALAAPVDKAMLYDEPLPEWALEPEGLDLEEALDEMLALPAERETMPEEIIPPARFITEELLISADEEPEASTQLADLVLGDAEIPEWLQTLKPPEIGGKTPVRREPMESSGPLAGIRGVIPVVPLMSDYRTAKPESGIVVNKEQLQRVALLQRLTQGDIQTAAAATSVSPFSTLITPRLILGGVLLLIILLSWLVPALQDLPAGFERRPLAETARNTFSEIEAAAGRPVLVAFEYTPAFAGELDAIGQSLLQQLQENDSPVIAISQYAAGGAMAARVSDSVEGMAIQNLGYLPGDATGLRRLSGCLTGLASCDGILGSDFSEEVKAFLPDIALIIVLTADKDNLVNWIEQIGSQSSIPIVAGITQSLGPLAVPYLSSGGLQAMVEGVPAAAAYETELQDYRGQASELSASLTWAMWFSVLTLLLGSLYFGLGGFSRATKGKSSVK